MVRNRFTAETHERQSRRKAWLVFIVLVVMVGIGFWVWSPASQNNAIEPSSEFLGLFNDPERQALAREIPERLHVEALGIDTGFEYLDLKENGEMEVPESYERVGWYMHSPLPGSSGPAVVVGHVDSKDGPAIFYHLGDLQENDEIVIIKAGGEEVRYRVTDVQRYSQDKFPTESVYGDTEGPELRLITCSGEYDQGTGRYSHNLVVYAEIVE